VRDRTGLTCSIGIGPNKLVAKVASDADKPDGFTVLSCEMARERFAGASPGLIPGIGPKTVARLADEGITTLAALRAAPEERLAELFGGRLGPHLRKLALFEDERPLELERRAKSESRETTFDHDLVGVDALVPPLEQLAAQLCSKLVEQDRRGRTIGIKVRLDDFSIHTRARTLPGAVSDAEIIGSVALELLRKLDPQRPVRLLGVGAASMESRPEPTDQLQLLG
jgi:DNA polymerase IV